MGNQKGGNFDQGTMHDSEYSRYIWNVLWNCFHIGVFFWFWNARESVWACKQSKKCEIELLCKFGIKATPVKVDTGDYFPRFLKNTFM